MDDQAAVQLPKYKCHSEVWAAKIADIAILDSDAGVRLSLDLGTGSCSGDVVVEMAWCNKHRPEVGGYFVQYGDRYKSYSPAGAFEEGYTRIDNTGRRIATGDVGFAGDALEYAWGVIANAWGGNWRLAPEDWQSAAARFRDEFWHPWLDMHGYTTHERSAEPHTKRDLVERASSCLGRSQPDEPVFLLCARDMHAPEAVRWWAGLYFSAGGNPSKHKDAMTCANRMEDWRKENIAKAQARTQYEDAKREADGHRTAEINRCIRILLDAGITDDGLLNRIRSGEEA